ncbi:MAG: CotH kinase family protein, partial [Blautia sp.]|nr:CotH kinase family protein [Blautia sp.]
MKYRILGGSACIVVFLLCILASGIGKVVIGKGTEWNRYEQHVEAEAKEPCTHDENILCTHLPLVEIDTDGLVIPGRSIKDETGTTIGREKSADGQDEISGTISVIDNETENNHIGDTPAVESRMKIHVRGNSSRSFDKSNFAIRLIDENEKNNPQSIMGMDAHHEWVLHGPYLDKTLMRNYMWYNIAGKFMDYAPNVRFCEVIVNGEYQGVYVMMERITAGGENSRLNFSVDKKDNTFTGYLLRLDRGSDNERKNIDTFTQYSLRTNLQINIEYPGAKNLTPELINAITQDFSYFEKSLYSYDYDDRKYGYKNLIDVDSFVDYFLINE